MPLVRITSGPAAAHQIRLPCVNRLKEIRDTTNDQSEKYFRKKFIEKKGLQQDHATFPGLQKPLRHVSGSGLLLDYCHSFEVHVELITERRAA